MIQIPSLSTKGQIASKYILGVVYLLILMLGAVQMTDLNARNHFAGKQEKLQVIS